MDSSDAEKIVQLDSEVYSDAYRVSPKITMERLTVNPQTDVGIINNSELAAYISLLPVLKRLFAAIKKEMCGENEIENNVLPYDRVGTYSVYLSSIVINKKRFPQLRVKFLIQCLQTHLGKLRKKGIFIDKIIATAVSVSGQKTLLKMRFKRLHGRTFVYSCKEQGCLFLTERPEWHEESKKYSVCVVNMTDLNERSESEWDTDT